MAPTVARSGRWLIVVAVVFAALAVAASIGHSELLLRVDGPVTRWMVRHRTPRLDRTFRAITSAGGMLAVVLGGLALAAVAWARSSRLAGLVLLATGVRPLVEGALKAIVGRDRPTGHRLVEASAKAFPSGHVFGTATLCLLAVVVVTRLTQSGRATRAGLIIGGGVTTLVAASRVYLGVHWLSDTIGGALAALLLVGALVLASEGRRDVDGGDAARPGCP